MSLSLSRALACVALAAMTLLALAAPGRANIVIAQFQTAGPGGASDEFLELVNTGDAIASIGGSDILRQPSEASPAGQCKIGYISSAVILQPGQHYLETGTAYSGSVASDHSLSGAPEAGQCGGTDYLSATLGGLVLSAGGGDVVGYGGTSLDFPTYGTFAAPVSGGSVERLLFGSKDTDSPSDWTPLATSQPHDSSFIDPDFDGLTTAADNCPNVANADQIDGDGDGIGNACDPDNDNDNVANVSDNCPTVANADQLDSDHDGLGNACDADDDNDGVPDAQDAFPLDPTRSTAAGGGGGGGGDTTAPSLTHVSLSPKTWALNAHGAVEKAVSARAGTHAKPASRGTTFRYTLSEAARVLFTIEQSSAGRMVGHACKKPSRANRHAHACTRYKLIGRFAQAGAAGKDRMAFSGRIGQRQLSPGRYRATLVATDAARNRSKPARLAFTVVSR
jgi:hypothetical protein